MGQMKKINLIRNVLVSYCVTADEQFDMRDPSREDGQLSKATLANFCLQIAEGMYFLAERKVRRTEKTEVTSAVY